MIRIIVADDHAVVRTGLQLLFDREPEMTIAGEVKNGDELLINLKEDTYDIVLLDLSMPGKDPFEVLKIIKINYPDLPVVIFSMNPESSYAIRMLRSGAAAYINKESTPDILIKAIKSVYSSGRYITPKQAEMLAGQLDHENILPHEKLTDREFQVMIMLSKGIKKKDIAELLSVSKNTIDNHRKNILNKLELKNNAELIAYTIKYDLIEH